MSLNLSLGMLYGNIRKYEVEQHTGFICKSILKLKVHGTNVWAVVSNDAWSEWKSV